MESGSWEGAWCESGGEKGEFQLDDLRGNVGWMNFLVAFASWPIGSIPYPNIWM
jgi:hypothetical protein